ncbi:MAG: polysaccharide biosynthesis/export family protein [Terracidiphilus sp.]
MKITGLILAMLFAAISVAGFSQSGTPAAASGNVSGPANKAVQGPALEQRNPRYQIRSGDTFQLTFDYSPEFNQEIAVQPDGYISLAGTSSVPVLGQTIPELENTIRHAYEGILRDPVISIALKDFEKPYFIAAGQVGKPGKYDLRSDLTATEAVAVAGGFTDASKHSQVVVFHHVDGNLVESHLLNLKSMLAKRDLAEDIHLEPGDVVYVPQNNLSKIKRFISAPSLGMYLTPNPF